MIKDRTVICDIISEMLDNPDEHGLYPTSVCFEKLNKYIESQRIEAIGWSYAYLCSKTDNGFDIRQLEAPEMLEAGLNDLSK